jgi:hypothetical protein
VVQVLRRFLVLAVLMFWQGGFTFYASVVVPIGQEELGHVAQGFITRRVTHFLNLAGAVGLIVLAWDAKAPTAPRRLKQWRWAAWSGMLASVAVLVWLHLRLDLLLDLDAQRVLDRGAFRAEHRAYLWVSTFAWACAVVYTVLSVISWSREDRGSSQLSLERALRKSAPEGVIGAARS